VNNKIQALMLQSLEFSRSNHVSNEAKILHFNQAVDQAMQTFPPVCSTGCSWCCYQAVDIYPLEKLIINKFISDKISLEDKDYIKQGAINFVKYYNKTYAENIEQYHRVNSDIGTSNASQYEYMITKIGGKPIKCPFLKNDNCLIYPVRPLMCRSHAMTSNPEGCLNNYTRSPSPQSRYVAITAHHLLKKDNHNKNPMAIVQAISEVIELDVSMKGFESG